MFAKIIHVHGWMCVCVFDCVLCKFIFPFTALFCLLVVAVIAFVVSFIVVVAVIQRNDVFLIKRRKKTGEEDGRHSQRDGKGRKRHYNNKNCNDF